MLQESSSLSGGIVWVCDRCLRDHIWDLLDGIVAGYSGIASIAEQAELGRPSLYRMLSGERDPRIGIVMKALSAPGIQLTIVPQQT